MKEFLREKLWMDLFEHERKQNDLPIIGSWYESNKEQGWREHKIVRVKAAPKTTYIFEHVRYELQVEIDRSTGTTVESVKSTRTTRVFDSLEQVKKHYATTSLTKGAENPDNNWVTNRRIIK